VSRIFLTYRKTGRGSDLIVARPEMKDKLGNWMNPGSLIVFIRQSGRIEPRVGVVTEFLWGGKKNRVKVKAYDPRRYALLPSEIAVYANDCIYINDIWRLQQPAPEGYYMPELFGEYILGLFTDYWEERMGDE